MGLFPIFLLHNSHFSVIRMFENWRQNHWPVAPIFCAKIQIFVPEDYLATFMAVSR